MSYPHPHPNDPIQKAGNRKPETYYLPPPQQLYTSGIKGQDYPPHQGDQTFTYPSHPGGYRTTSNGLNIAAEPWVLNTKLPKTRQSRANHEAMVQNYWPQSTSYGPQGTTPSYNALIT